jgi:EAL domain-containing protein (putative c-di-GMP-specific phosphodiesterase class I)
MTTLDDVLTAGAVRSVLQPIVDLASGAVVAYEALARGPEGTPLERPDLLFAEARRLGRLAELDELCRRTALRAAVDKGVLSPLTLFVNVEPEVLDVAPLDDLLAIADELPGRVQVVLEITERALAARPAELLRTVERVRSLGWKVALDDVGAEDLSLAFMPLLRPEVVKLDLRLVQQRPGPAIAEIMNAVNAYAERTVRSCWPRASRTSATSRRRAPWAPGSGRAGCSGRPAADLATHLPQGELVLPLVDDADWSLASPFTCLPAGTPLRRSAKALLIEVSKHLEREA